MKTKNIKAFDDRRDIAIPGDRQETLRFCIEHFIETAGKAIEEHGSFSVALSGGSTPKAIFQGLADKAKRDRIDWSKALIFWSDERCVPPDSRDSNYRMAMEAGFVSLPIPTERIFRLKGEADPEEYAKRYEEIIKEQLKGRGFDLVMLGMGEDGHTASLFPRTHGLHAPGRLVIANYVPQKECWRLSFTFDCINAAENIAIYVLGENKAEMVHKVFHSPFDPDNLPIQRIGSSARKALWILDSAAAAKL